MCPHNHNRDDHGHQNVQPHVGKDQRNNGDEEQRAKHGPVVDGVVGHHDRLVAEEVEEEPKDEDDEEDDHGHGVVQEAKEEDEECEQRVVDPEVYEISPDAVHGIAVGVGEGEGRRIDELKPRAAGGVESTGGGGDA